MDYGKVNQWLKDRGIVLAEDFNMALDNLIEEYKKNKSQFRGNLCPFGYQLPNRA